MKRYNIEPTIGFEVLDGADIRPTESPKGDWVRWRDVKELLELLVPPAEKGATTTFTTQLLKRTKELLKEV